MTSKQRYEQKEKIEQKIENIIRPSRKRLWMQYLDEEDSVNGYSRTSNYSAVKSPNTSKFESNQNIDEAVIKDLLSQLRRINKSPSLKSIKESKKDKKKDVKKQDSTNDFDLLSTGESQEDDLLSLLEDGSESTLDVSEDDLEELLKGL